MWSWSTVSTEHLPFHLCAQILYKFCTINYFTPCILYWYVYRIATWVSCNITWYMSPDDDSVWIETCIGVTFNINIKGRTQCVLLVEWCELAIDSARNERCTVIRITWDIWISVQTYSGNIANDALMSKFVNNISWGPTFYIGKQKFQYWTEEQLHKQPLDDSTSLYGGRNGCNITVNCDQYVNVPRNSTLWAE
jgi:hypothetical protein